MIRHFLTSGIHIFKYNTSRNRPINNFYGDINREVLRLSITFIHFIIFRLTVEGDKINLFSDLRSTIVGFLAYNLCTAQIQKDDYYKLSNLIFLISFLLVPILHTLTKEICSDTIYFWYFICQMIFVVNSTIFAIYDKKFPVRLYSEEEVLKLEESINIPKKYFPSMVYGYVSVTIGIIFLTSRFTNISSVFCFLTASMMCFVTIPKFQENAKIHRSFIHTLLWMIFVLRFMYIVDKFMFYILLFMTVYIYGFLAIVAIL
ncbi:hypothetical protein P3W45_000248 [Vairimorpha bombi]|jgi:hypothetical protein